MINSENILNVINSLVQPNIKIIILIIIIFILLLKNFDINIIFILGFLLNIFLYHKEIIKILNDLIKSKNKYEKIIEDNQRQKKDITFDTEITKIMDKLKKYSKYNKNSYEEGYNHMKNFMIIIHDLERSDIGHPRQYFENAEFHLKKSLNSFQSISFSVPEENFIKSLKYNKYEQTKLGNKIGKLCKRLHKHCHYLLYNLSLRFNEDWSNKPDIYKTEINYNYENVEPNEYDYEKWNLY